MGTIAQQITDDYAIYNGDCCEVMQELDNEFIDLSVYSPPFGGLYHYSAARGICQTQIITKIFSITMNLLSKNYSG